jgi:hypothetical protein
MEVGGYGPNVPLSSGHRVIDITNEHFIHTGPLEGIGVSIYLEVGAIRALHSLTATTLCHRNHVKVVSLLKRVGSPT